MSTQQTNLKAQRDGRQEAHNQSIDMTGLEHIFKWASDEMPDGGEDGRVKQAREKRIRKQVLEVVQKSREDKVLAEANYEISYLQRRVIALLTKLQETLEENSLLKQIMLTQYYALQQIPSMERELRELKSIQCEKDSAVTERRYLMDGLTKLKVERDYLEEVLISVEAESSRLAKQLDSTRQELNQIKANTWWKKLISWLK